MNPSAGPMSNGLSTPMQATPLQNMASRPPIPSQSANAGPSTSTPGQRPLVTPKPQKTPKSTPSSALPAPALDDVHAAFLEFRAKEEDKVRRRRRGATLLLPHPADHARSVSQCSAYIAIKSEPRILVASVSTCKSVLPT